MNAKLKEILKQFEEIERQLQLPEIVSNQEQVVKLSIKYKELKDVVEKQHRLDDAQIELGKAKESLKEFAGDHELEEMAQDDIRSLTKEIAELEKGIDLELNPPDPMDKKDVIIEIRAGAGGDEAGLFSAEMFRLYAKYAENQGWRMEIISQNGSSIGGFKEVIFEINGHNVYSNMKYESGVHRVQRVPETEKQGRVHTSTITIAVLPQIEEQDFNISPNDLKIDVFRAGGHGGQSVNTTDSAVRITHLPTNTVVICQDEKSQFKNKDKALKVLRSRLMAVEQEKKERELSEKRLSQIGTGSRSEKIRTYNFPQDRITDHRIPYNWNNIGLIMEGDLDKIVTVLKEEEHKMQQG
jgi:peptide chain release factor 1